MKYWKQKNVLFLVANEIKPADFEIKLQKILRRGEEAVHRSADVTDVKSGCAYFVCVLLRLDRKLFYPFMF